MISILSILESITCTLSLSTEEIKFFAIVNCIFRMSDFLKLFMSFRYGLMLIRCSSTDNVLVLSQLLSYSIYLLIQKMHYFYWFIINLFSFFTLKKIFNTSKYSICNSFSFCFLSKNISYIFNSRVIKFFFSLKRLFISLIIFSSWSLRFFIVGCYEKKIFLKR